MTKTYADIIDAMIEAEQKGFGTGEIEKVVLSDESMDTFLIDDSFTEEVGRRQKESIGTDWELRVESGSDDYLVISDGTKIFL